MRIRNKFLPRHLETQHSPDYVHDIEMLKTERFMIHLKHKGGAEVSAMLCSKWAREVEDYFTSTKKLTAEMQKESDMNTPEKNANINSNSNYYFDSLGTINFAGRNIQKMETSWGELTRNTRLNIGAKLIVPVNSEFFGEQDEVCIVTWSDGTTTKVCWDYGDEHSYELALAIAFIKKFHGLKAYDSLLDSVGKTEREKAAAEELRQEKLAAEKIEQERRYAKRVKKAARRYRKREKFRADLQRELNKEFS